jgi:hypothetical protein
MIEFVLAMTVSPAYQVPIRPQSAAEGVRNPGRHWSPSDGQREA